jgi:hypothetical protein
LRHVSGLAPGAPVARASRPGLQVGRLCESQAARLHDHARNRLAVGPQLSVADRIAHRAGTVRSTCSTRYLAPLRPDRGSVLTGWLYSQRRQDGRWGHVGLHPADRDWNGAARASHQTVAANGSADRYGLQEQSPNFGKGGAMSRPSAQPATIESGT